MKALAKVLVLMMLLSVMVSAMYVTAIASEDIPPEGYDSPATADFANDAEMMQFSYNSVLGNLYVSDATSTYIGSIENSPALMADSTLTTAVADIDDEIDDEDAEYEEPMAINDQPNTGRVSTVLPVLGAVALLCAVPVMTRKK